MFGRSSADSDAFGLHNVELGYRKRVRRAKRLEALLRKLNPYLPAQLQQEVVQTLAMSWSDESEAPLTTAAELDDA